MNKIISKIIRWLKMRKVTKNIEKRKYKFYLYYADTYDMLCEYYGKQEADNYLLEMGYEEYINNYTKLALKAYGLYEE